MSKPTLAGSGPTKLIATDDPSAVPEVGIALCLSGGGFRAMLFHAGSLWRLNEAGYLPRIARISSVSAGSITAATLGLAWDDLNFDSMQRSSAFEERVVAPLRALACHTIDVRSVLRGLALRGSVSDRVTAEYAKHLFGEATLQDLPDDRKNGNPRFVINATNLSTGSLWRFTRRYMADDRFGRVSDPRTSLATAVAASSAFPPVLSPLRLDIDPDDVRPTPGADLFDELRGTPPTLADGGIYDDLGLETVWKDYKTVLVSNGGGQLGPDAKPKGDWLRSGIRVVNVIENQVRTMRKQHLIDSYLDGRREGAFWTIRGDIADYPAPGSLAASIKVTGVLAAIPTRLAKIAARRQEQLINWGYAITDAAMRSYVDPTMSEPVSFPYPGSTLSEL